MPDWCWAAVLSQTAYASCARGCCSAVTLLPFHGEFFLFEIVISAAERTGAFHVESVRLRRPPASDAAQVPVAMERRVQDANGLRLQITAALIGSLEAVNPFTKVVVMDARGRVGKALARAVSAHGLRGYVLRGGFTAWRGAGLPVKQGTYTVSIGACPSTAVC
jgi:rhodanese-related sulfurtransferase